ncbi:methyltransferase [Rhodomicrobium vannielii]|uniref:methyltransferase n=1 Tax=Rhodomicrobium vannielii TaxID=1069 RepID=UPI000321AE76|nr:class I SAM-dependent methyltransferase [Rhodomicrobium vannielii]
MNALLGLAEGVRATGYRFTTITPSSHALVNARPGNREARDIEGVLGWSRPFQKDVIPAHLFGLMEKAGVLQREGALWRSTVRFSTLQGDLFMHSAFPTTARDAVFFGPDTYKFVDAINAWLNGRAGQVGRAADVCAGAGPGGIAIAKACPGAEVLLLDLNPKAVDFAAVNAAVAGRPNACATMSNLFSNAAGSFDLVVSHPPYLIDASERAYRHGGGPLGAGLAITIIKAAIERLSPSGTLLLFTGVAIVEGRDPFLAAAAEALDRAGIDWAYREVDPDVFGEELARDPYQIADRIALVVVTATRAASA